MGVPQAALAKTVQDYNAGAPQAGASLRASRPALATPPYYALGPAKTYVIFTDGGLRITERMEVVNAQDEIIPRLYAAGSNGQSGMLLEGHGHHLGWAFVSGRLAGRNAALDTRPPQVADPDAVER